MKTLLFLLFYLISLAAFSQNYCHADIMLQEGHLDSNEIKRFEQYDFSKLWMHTANHLVYGVIGEDYQRIRVKFLKIKKSPENPKLYLVEGKTASKDSIKTFKGTISLQFIFMARNQNSKNQPRGLLIAQYEFLQDKAMPYTGVFSGELQSKWILNEKNQIEYDYTHSNEGGYFNNAFMGSWKRYNSNIDGEKVCNWGDYRVPLIRCNFDTGTSKFNVHPNYTSFGWFDVALNHRHPLSNVATQKLLKNGKRIKAWWE